MKTNAKREARLAKQERLDEIDEVWQTSTYAEAINSFRDNRDLPFIGHMIIAVRCLEGEIVKELKEGSDDYDTEDEHIRDLVLERLLEWEERLREMAQMLVAASDRAWAIFNEIDGDEEPLP